MNNRGIFYFVINTAFNNEADRLMEPHIVVNVLLDYLGSLKAWSNARTLCRQTHAIATEKSLRRDVCSARTFIAQHECMACLKYVEKPRWIVFKCLPVAMRRYLVTCHHWRCQTASLFSMIDELAADNIFILKTPFQKSLSIDVPRSDGSTTPGSCITHGLMNIRGEYCVMTHWSTVAENYSKNVAWSHYFQEPPQFIFKDLSDQ